MNNEWIGEDKFNLNYSNNEYVIYLKWICYLSKMNKLWKMNMLFICLNEQVISIDNIFNRYKKCSRRRNVARA